MHNAIMHASYMVPHDGDLITSLSLLVEGRCQLSFALDPLYVEAEGGK